MYEKLIKVARRRGYCCMWAFLEAHKATPTNTLVKLAKEAGFPLTSRAIRHQRRAYRQHLTTCEKKSTCLKLHLQASRTTA